MFLVWRIVVAFGATVVCIYPVGLAVGVLALGGGGPQILSIAHHGLMVVGAFAIVEIGSRMRNGGFRLKDRFSVGWVGVSTALGQVAGFALEPYPFAGALGCGFVGGLVATLVWSHETETETEEETAPRSPGPFRRAAGRFGIAVLLGVTLVGVAHAIGTLLGWS